MLGEINSCNEMAKKVGPTGKIVATDFSEQMLLKGVEKILSHPKNTISSISLT
jgi:ubiquinone/menaquinone biosynthesis C-methylase UbiE